jgi:hypothetical protein
LSGYRCPFDVPNLIRPASRPRRGIDVEQVQVLHVNTLSVVEVNRRGNKLRRGRKLDTLTQVGVVVLPPKPVAIAGKPEANWFSTLLVIEIVMSVVGGLVESIL